MFFSTELTRRENDSRISGNGENISHIAKSVFHPIPKYFFPRRCDMKAAFTYLFICLISLSVRPTVCLSANEWSNNLYQILQLIKLDIDSEAGYETSKMTGRKMKVELYASIKTVLRHHD